MITFENDGTKSRYLRMTYEYLLTIPPIKGERYKG